MKQAPRIKRINSIPAQNIYRDLLHSEGNCKAVVGGGAGSGIGPGHMATTLTSFNVSAIANNPTSIESPRGTGGVQIYENDDINTQEQNEIY